MADYKAAMKEASAAVNRKFKTEMSAPANVAIKPPKVWLTTGSLALDRLCRGFNPGGIPIGPCGRIVHIAGEWSMGKSLLLDHLLKSNQDIGGHGLIQNTEGSGDPHFANLIGLDLSKVEHQSPTTVGKCIDMGILYHQTFRKLMGNSIPFLWGLDSLDSTETDKTYGLLMSDGGGWHYGGGKSEEIGAGLRHVTDITKRYPTTFVMLNQTRESIGQMFGPRKRTTGGNAPHFYSSLEIMLSAGPLGVVRDPKRVSKLTGDQLKRFGLRADAAGDVIGRWVRAKITKSRLSPTQFTECDFYMAMDKGIHKWAGLCGRMIEEGRVDIHPDNSITHFLSNGNQKTFADEVHWVSWLNKNMEVLGQ